MTVEEIEEVKEVSFLVKEHLQAVLNTYVVNITLLELYNSRLEAIKRTTPSYDAVIEYVEIKQKMNNLLESMRVGNTNLTSSLNIFTMTIITAKTKL